LLDNGVLFEQAQVQLECEEGHLAQKDAELRATDVDFQARSDRKDLVIQCLKAKLEETRLQADVLGNSKFKLEGSSQKLHRTVGRLEERAQKLQVERANLERKLKNEAVQFDVPSTENTILSIKSSQRVFCNRRERFFREAEAQFLRCLNRPGALSHNTEVCLRPCPPMGHEEVICKGTQQFRVITQVDVNLNGHLWACYKGRNRSGQREEQWGFHGTNDAALGSILQNGYSHGACLAATPQAAMALASCANVVMCQFYADEAQWQWSQDAWLLAQGEDVYPRYVVYSMPSS